MLAGSLRELNLGINSFYGSLLDSLCDLNLLESLSVDANYFSGTIPERIGNLRELTYFSANSSVFSGTLTPDSMSDLSKLEYLYCNNCTKITTFSNYIFGQLVSLKVCYLVPQMIVFCTNFDLISRLLVFLPVK